MFSFLQVQQVSEGLKDLQMRIPERPAEAASQMELKALRAQAQTIGREMEQEQAGVAVLLQQVMLLQGRGPILGEATEEHPVAQNLQVMQANYETYVGGEDHAKSYLSLLYAFKTEV